MLFFWSLPSLFEHSGHRDTFIAIAMLACSTNGNIHRRHTLQLVDTGCLNELPLIQYLHSR